MNLLFTLYGDMTCNSAGHVDALARELTRLGWDCAVAVPDPAVGAGRFGPPPYRIISHEDAATGPWPFADRCPPAIVHLWTPREGLRKLHDRLVARCPDVHTMIHLEDNEWHVTRGYLGPTAYSALESGPDSVSLPDVFTHPIRVQPLLEAATGFTLLIDRLGEFVPAGKPQTVFWPAADPAVFKPRPRNDALRAELGLSPNECVLTYHGNTHGANHREVRGLYLAVALLRRTGTPTRLIRLGLDCYTDSYQPAQGYPEWAREFVLDFGFVADRRRLADVLACADLFVQPGTADPFNDYRFPSKLPEFFALGRPVILPRTNIGLVARHGIDAFVLDRADGSGIAAAVAELRADLSLANRLAAGAMAFAETHFSWPRAARKLSAFYYKSMYQSQPTGALSRAA